MSRSRTAGRWGWFGAWVVAGAAMAIGVLGALTIGILVVPVAAVGIVVLATRRGSTDGIAGIMSGLGVPLLLVAYFNRNGPGDVCRINANGSSCVQEWSPWPWLAVALALIASGIVVFVWSTRRRAATP